MSKEQKKKLKPTIEPPKKYFCRCNTLRQKIDVGELEEIIRKNPFTCSCESPMTTKEIQERYEEDVKSLAQAIAEYINKDKK